MAEGTGWGMDCSRAATVRLRTADTDACIFEHDLSDVWAEYARKPGSGAASLPQRSQLQLRRSDWSVRLESCCLGQPRAGPVGHLSALLQRFPLRAAAG